MQQTQANKRDVMRRDLPREAIPPHLQRVPHAHQHEGAEYADGERDERDGEHEVCSGVVGR